MCHEVRSRRLAAFAFALAAFTLVAAVAPTAFNSFIADVVDRAVRMIGRVESLLGRDGTIAAGLVALGLFLQLCGSFDSVDTAETLESSCVAQADSTECRSNSIGPEPLVGARHGDPRAPTAETRR